MELLISVIPSPDDPPWRSDDYQAGLRNLGTTLKADGLEAREVGAHSAREGCVGCLSGEWKVKLEASLGPVLGAPIGSWLEGRHGRTVRLTIGEMEADVRTVDELLGAIKIANHYQEVAENES